jgi:hypothetical protein
VANGMAVARRIADFNLGQDKTLLVTYGMFFYAN